MYKNCRCSPAPKKKKLPVLARSSLEVAHRLCQSPAQRLAGHALRIAARRASVHRAHPTSGAPGRRLHAARGPPSQLPRRRLRRAATRYRSVRFFGPHALLFCVMDQLMGLEGSMGRTHPTESSGNERIHTKSEHRAAER